MKARVTLILGTAAILVVTFLAYTPVLKAGFFWDDHLWITENRTLGTWAGLLKFWLPLQQFEGYWPLTATSFWIEHRLWGLNPTGYHVANILLHAANALLLWLVLSQLRIPGAWTAAAIFALHPVHVESVAWIMERKNVLSCFFYLITISTYINGFYALALAAFACAVLSKATTCTLPFILLFLMPWPLWRTASPPALQGRNQFSRSGLKLTLPFFAIGALAGAIAIGNENFFAPKMIDWGWSLPERVLIAGRAVWFYIGKLLWPYPVTYIYPHWQVNAAEAWQYLFPLAIAALFFTLAFIRRPFAKASSAALLFFIVTLAPTLGFFNVNYMRHSFVADHWQYHASLSLIALMAAGLARIKSRIPTFALLAIFGVLTWNQAHVFSSEEAYWRHTLKRNPSSWTAYLNLGTVLSKNGMISEAALDLQRAIELNPNCAEAHNNLAVILIHESKLEEAAEHLRESLRINPDYSAAHTNLGIALAGQGKFDQAIPHLAEAIRLEPDLPKGSANLEGALRLAQQGITQN